MHEHHHAALDQFIASVVDASSFDAVILSGSLAKGTARPTSDLDLYLVVSDDEYRDRRARHDLAVFAPCDYPGGYVDGKVVSTTVLEAAAQRGTEPMRSSFTGSRVVYSRIDDLQPLVDRIAVYPEANRATNMRDFFAHLALHASYFGPQAFERDDPFLLNHALTSTTLFAGRLVLTYNRILFPCPKQLLSTVATAADQPTDFVARTEALLRAPSPDALQAYLQLVGGFADWGLPEDEILTLFMELDEWSWLDHEPPIAQR
jgi:hypothetical protein